MVMQEPVSDRKKELIGLCLEKFLEKGLYGTSTKDLAQAVNLHQGALYFHFANKDEIVLNCVEEAGKILEDKLLIPAVSSLRDEENWLDILVEQAEKYAPVMKFFTQVRTAPKYHEKMQPIMDRMKKRHSVYAEKIAKQLNCEPDEISSYLYLGVVIFSNYMVFDEKMYFEQPIEIVKNALRAIRDQHRGNDGAERDNECQ